MSAEKQEKTTSVENRTAHEIKVRLLEKKLSVADLARSLRPKRPRSTVSQAIHHSRFPKVRRQIVKKLFPPIKNDDAKTIALQEIKCPQS